MIHLALQDLRHDRLTFGFSVLGLGILVFAFLLLIPLSLAVTRLGEAGGLPQNLILVEQNVLQPELSRVPPGLAGSVSAILGERLRTSLDRAADAACGALAAVTDEPAEVM